MLRNILMLVCFFLSPVLQAATFTVTKTADTADGTCDGDCSLREAVIAANAAGGLDTITVPAGTYSLSVEGRGEELAATGDLDITDDLIIQGASAATTLIDGRLDFFDEGLGTNPDRVFHIVSGDLTLQNLTVQHGAPAFGDDGGAILYAGSDTFTIENCIIKESIAFRGGGIALISGAGGAILVMEGSTLADNIGSSEGGGLVSNGGVSANNLTFSGVSFIDNSNGGGGVGGGLSVNDDSVFMDNSTFSGNSGGTSGGGAFFNGAALVFLDNNTFANNEDGGILNGGVATITMRSSIFFNNTGGNCGGTITSEGNNIEDADDCGLNDSGDIANEDPLLGDLTDEGVGKIFYPLLEGSPAIDTGNSANCPATDQRGIARLDGDNNGVVRCDMGAVEFEHCGDGVLQGDEVCDDGNALNTDACPNTCQVAVCGDGFTRATVETCDDGNTTSGDGCSNICVVEESALTSFLLGANCSLVR